MKFSAALALCGLGFCCLVAQSAPGRLNSVVVSGVDYVRLDDIARARGWQGRWTVPKKILQFTGAGGTLAFEVDSRRMVLNGISVYLNWPVARNTSGALISRLDLDSTLRPLLSPTKAPKGRMIRTIALDPGHGGIDPGNREGRQLEKTYTLLLARELGAQLARAGFNVCLIRNSDTLVDLDDRTVIARKRGADLLLSLHFNSADGPGASAVNGAEVYCMTPPRASSTNARGQGTGTGPYPGNRNDPENILLAYQIQKALVAKLAMDDRGVRRARFAVLRNASMPAVLIEGGFMTHPADARRIYSAPWRREFAQTIVSGVLAYKRIVEW